MDKVLKLKKSFSTYLKTLFIFGEFVFLLLSFLFVSSYIEDKEQKRFIDDARHSTDLVNLYTAAKLRASTFKPILNQVSKGIVSHRGLLKKVDGENKASAAKQQYFLYTEEDGFYPNLPISYQEHIKPNGKYENSTFIDNGDLFVVKSITVERFTIFLLYSITGDPVLKKNIKATQLGGYLYSGREKFFWLIPNYEVDIDFDNKSPVNIDKYKMSNKSQLVTIHNNIGVNKFNYLISDKDYVYRVFIERIIIGIIFIFKFLLTLIFTVIVTKSFSTSLNNLVKDSKEIAKIGNNLTENKNYRFKEFQSLINAFSVVIDKKNLTEEELRMSKENMEETVKERTAELSKAIEKAEEASSAKMNFLAQISHEIRTPMNCIIGFCEIMISEGEIAKYKEYSNKIIKESETLLKLINDILDDSKIENGKMTLEINKVNINSFVDRIIELGNPFDNKDHIRVNKVIGAGVPEHIGIDELRLYQIVSNLFFNALKYTRKGNVSIIVNCTADILEISVIDTGIGIPEDRIDTIFNDYERLDGSLRIKYRGTGLGLTITKKIIEIMGGNISVKSVQGSGSCFTVSIPYNIITDDYEPDTLIEKDVEYTNRNGNILLVEDYPANRIIARCHLESSGYNVFEVENGQDALEICNTMKFDLILMDIQMPVLDGFDTTVNIRSSNGLNSKTPILAMTANGLKSVEEECDRVGMNGVVLKPIRKKSFIERVHSFIKEASLV